MILTAEHIIKAETKKAGWPWTDESDPRLYEEIKDWPKISIITPSYNQGQYLEQTIRSVLYQHYPNLEYIIIDGGSTDQSVDIIRHYKDSIHYWVSEPDKGQSDALNKGFSRATGELIAWINSDDYYEKDALYKAALYYKKTGYQFLCGSCRMIDPNEKLIQQLITPVISFKTLIRYWRPHFCPPQPSIFFTRKAFLDLGKLNPHLRYTMDYDLWLKASRKYTFQVIRDNLSYYRVHHDSKTGSSGGLAKFIPEWRMLIKESLAHEPVSTRIQFFINERVHIIKKNLRRFSNKQALKNTLRQWLTKTNSGNR